MYTVTFPVGYQYLVSEGNGHDGDEEAEEGFQLTQAVLVEQQEGEGVRYCDQHSTVQRYPAHSTRERGISKVDALAADEEHE